MELKSIDIIKSPEPGKVRLQGEVSYENALIPSEIYWFDYPEEFEKSLSLKLKRVKDLFVFGCRRNN